MFLDIYPNPRDPEQDPFGIESLTIEGELLTKDGAWGYFHFMDDLPGAFQLVDYALFQPD